LREYFTEATRNLPPWARRGNALAAGRGAGARLAAPPGSNAQRLARRFIAGSNLDEALPLRRGIAPAQKLTFTMDLLGRRRSPKPRRFAAKRFTCKLIEEIDRRSTLDR